MAEIVVMPRQGNTVESCVIVEWRRKEGDSVEIGDILCTVETDKAAVDVESEYSGTLLKILQKEDEDVPVFDPIAVVGRPGEDISNLIFSSGNEASKPVAEGTESAVSGQQEKEDSVSYVKSRAPRKVSPRARKLAEAEGISAEQLSGSGPRGRVIERDVRAAIDAGEASGVAVAGGAAAGEDVRAGAGRPAPVTERSAAPVSAVESAGYEDIPVRSVRKVIAERMRTSLNQSAQLTINGSASAESLLRWRGVFKNSQTESGLNGITINDLVLFAVSRIVPSFPEFNAHFLGDKIRRFRDVNIGVAVDTPRGLMVPVIRAAQRKSLLDISREVKSLARKCVDGTAAPQELSGGTITVTNLGSYGVESFTPVLNTPEVAILGVCSIQPKPVVREDATLFIPHIGLSLTIDHQAVDGAPAARFLQELSNRLRDFEIAAAL